MNSNEMKIQQQSVHQTEQNLFDLSPLIALTTRDSGYALTVETVALRFASNFVSILNGANSIQQCSLNDRRLQVVQIQSHLFYFSQKLKLVTMILDYDISSENSKCFFFFKKNIA
jgi:hypothetical protein